MKIRVPPRPYHTFSELVSKWKRSENSLRYAIISGELKPCIKLTGSSTRLAWTAGDAGTWKGVVRTDFNSSEPIDSRPTAWLYLQDPKQTGPFDCTFQVACDARDPMEDRNINFDLWYKLDPTCSMSNVVAEAVFLNSEVERYEKAFGWSHQPDATVSKEVEKPIQTSERNSLLTIIAVLCKEAKLDYKTASKTSDLIEGMADSMGVSIGATTIRDHLKRIPDALRTRVR
jgi:hypothetical protein